MKNIKMFRIVGISLFVTGSIAAITAAAKVPPAGTSWVTAISPTFIAGLAWAIIGNIIWHRSERKIVLGQLEEHKNDTEKSPLGMLKSTVPAIELLYQKAQTLQGMELCEEVDKVLDQYVHPFTEKRKTFMDILGQAKGAEILLDVAYGERMLNRVWSAASDGYHQEALNSLVESLNNYKKAAGKLA